MAITYNPYGWEIRPREPNPLKFKEERDAILQKLYLYGSDMSIKTMTRLLCQALMKHEQYINAMNTDLEEKFDCLTDFDMQIRGLYRYIDDK